MQKLLEFRPFKDIDVLSAYLEPPPPKSPEESKKKKRPPKFVYPSLFLPGGIKNPIVQKLGLLDEDLNHNTVILRPDGTIALMVSGIISSNNIITNLFQLEDEKKINALLAKGELEEAKRLIFALAPIETQYLDPKKKKRPIKIPVPYLRTRAKIYIAMGDLKAAYADAEKAYLKANSVGANISMRTEELDKSETLRNKIMSLMKKK